MTMMQRNGAKLCPPQQERYRGTGSESSTVEEPELGGVGYAPNGNIAIDGNRLTFDIELTTPACLLMIDPR